MKNLLFLFLLYFSSIKLGFGSAWQPITAPEITVSAAGIVDNQIYAIGSSPSLYLAPPVYKLNVLDPTEWSRFSGSSACSYNNNDFWSNPTFGEGSGIGFNGKFYVFGGCDSDAWDLTTRNFVEEYDPVSDSWRSKAPMLTLRSGANTVVYNNEIYLIGGAYSQHFYHMDRYDKQIQYKIIEAYNPETDTWRTITHTPSLRRYPAVAVVDDKMYMIGGGALIGGVYAHPSRRKWAASKKIYIYKFNNNVWIKDGFTPLPTPRLFFNGSAAPVLDGKIYLIGGFTVEFKNKYVASTKVEIYDPISNTWQVGPSLPKALTKGAFVSANNTVFALGSSNEDGDKAWMLINPWKSTLNDYQTCDLNADGKFSTLDAKLFAVNCRKNTAYWACDLNKDGKFTAKDTIIYKHHWKKASVSCPSTN